MTNKHNFKLSGLQRTFTSFFRPPLSKPETGTGYNLGTRDGKSVMATRNSFTQALETASNFGLPEWTPLLLASCVSRRSHVKGTSLVTVHT